jgi:pentatricopeptide repeat protein
MSNHFEKSREANELRKSGQVEKALVLYRELSKDSLDPFVAAGLLHCLRKQGFFEEALRLCDDMLQQHTDSDWCRNEIMWTLIQGKLERLDESASVEETASVAVSILALNPRESATKWRIVRRVLKAAKSRNRWDIISHWIYKVNPEELSRKQLTGRS